MNKKAYIQNITAMAIFATIGLFARMVDLPSSELAFIRTILAGACLLTVMAVRRQRFDRVALRANLPRLLLSGTIMGFNWVMMFEAYKNTSVSVATLVYYLAPVIVLLLSPLVLKERLTWPKILGVSAAMLGMLLVNGGPVGGPNPVKGVLFAAIAAAMYASVILLNKMNKGLSGIETTLVQFAVAATTLLVYNLFALRGQWMMPRGLSLWSTLILGIVHTGLAYLLYFSSSKKIKGQSLALISYIDPFLALVLSALILGERLNAVQILGTVLILGGAAFGELYHSKKAEQEA